MPHNLILTYRVSSFLPLFFLLPQVPRFRSKFGRERERERDGKSDILLLKVGPISISPSLNHILSPSLPRIIPRTPSNHRPPSLPLHPSTGTMTTMASLDSLSFSPSSNSHPSSHPSLTIKRDYAVTKQPFNTKDSRCIITAV